MENSIKNIYRPAGNEKWLCPCKAVKEIKHFTSSLLKETRPSLKEDDMEEAVDKLIAKAQGRLSEEKKKNADKRKNCIKVLSSAISTGKNESAAPSSSSFKPSSVSTPKLVTFSLNHEIDGCNAETPSTSANQEKGTSTSRTKPAPKGKSYIPIFQRKCSSMRETKTVTFGATPEKLSVSQRLFSSTTEFTPKREFRSQSKVSSTKIQVTPRHLCETRYGKSSSNSFSLTKEKSTTKRRTVSTPASRAEDSYTKSNGLTDELKFLRDSLREMVADLGALLNKK